MPATKGGHRSADAVRGSRPTKTATGLPPSPDELHAVGRALRERVPRSEHSEWKPPKNRRDPVEMVTQSSKGRIPQLVPIRYGRMAASPLAFYRGTANIMAADLASTRVTGIHAQLCGDCHALNFNGFATPERRVIFDLADFDQTLPGPWEWDVKRLAVSLILAARSNGFPRSVQRDTALTCVRRYREHLAEYAGMAVLDVWYASVDEQAFVAGLRERDAAAALTRRIEKVAARQLGNDRFPKMIAAAGRYTIADEPPLIFHHPYLNMTTARHDVLEAFAQYRDALPHDRQVLLDRYRLMDISAKVVGIGSVGTVCAVILLMAAEDDFLFLQVKQAAPSVLEPYVKKSAYSAHGQRVVVGQRLMQSASDIFLGWCKSRSHHYYVRQLRDMKIAPRIDRMDPVTLVDYAGMCGWTLARAHARSADSAMIAGYLGRGNRFDKAVARFASAYADQAERDYKAFMRAVRDGRIEVRDG
jgi:uncharacterized protein (DUF2252 family)